jgi:hypothetical protein
VAPILFLQIEKLFSTLLPNTELSLRIFPLLCFWASLFFFYQIIRTQLKNQYAIVLALSLFVFNNLMIYYSSELKQYMSDVFVLLGLFYLVLKDYKKEKTRFYLLGIAGTLAVFLSNVTPVILLTCGVYLIYDDFWVTKRKRLIPISAVFASWLCAFFVYFCFFVYNHPAREFMTTFWSDSFLPIHSIPDTLTFLAQKKIMIQYALFPHIIVLIYLMLFVSLTGIIVLIRKKRIRLIILTCMPILLHLFLSAFHLYPFESRLMLYTFPGLFIVCAAGLGFITDFIFARLKISDFKLLYLLIPAMFWSFFYGFPVKSEEMKESIDYIQKNIEEGDRIYVYYFAIFPYEYYNQIGYSTIQAPVTNGKFTGWPIYSTGEITEVDALRGKTWLLLVHGSDDEQLILNRVDSLGHKRLKEYKTKGSSAYLYDFGE